MPRRSDHPKRPKPQSLDSNATALLKDIEALSKALAIPSKSPPSIPSSTSSASPLPHRPINPAPSIWKWRPFKALSHIGHRRFDLRFTLRVLSVRSLSSEFNGKPLLVQWRRAGSSDTPSTTRPVRVSRGAAEFPDLLDCPCHVYAAKSGHHNSVKYEPKQFVIAAVVVGDAKLGLGEHRVDLTKGLPTMIEEIESDDCRGEWGMELRLSGKGKGAVMSVKFGFEKDGRRKVETERVGSSEGSSREMGDVEERVLRRSESVSAVERIAVLEGVECAQVTGVEVVSLCGDEDLSAVVDQDSVLDVCGDDELNVVSLNVDDGDDVVEMKNSEENGGDYAEASRLRKLEDGKLDENVELEKAEDVDSVDFYSPTAVEDRKVEGPEFTVVQQGVEVSPMVEAMSDDTVENAEDEAVENHASLSLGIEADATVVLKEMDEHAMEEDDLATEKCCEEQALEHVYLHSGAHGVIEKHASTVKGLALQDVDGEQALERVEDDNLSSQEICEEQDLESADLGLGLQEVYEKHASMDNGLALPEMNEQQAVGEKAILSVNDILEQKSLLVGESSMKDLDFAFSGLYMFDSSSPEDSPPAELENLGLSEYLQVKSSYKSGRISKSLGFDEVTDAVADEFLQLLDLDSSSPLGWNSDSDPESPREKLLEQFSKDDAWRQFVKDSSSETESPKERLWRQFQNECLANGGGLLLPDVGSEKESDWDEDLDLASIIEAAESEEVKLEEAMRSKARAKLLEDAETEALMREMGLDENAFHSSPPGSPYGFGSPIDFSHEDPFELDKLPPLADGLGPVLQTKDGGFLRSMSPSLFKNAKNKGSLIMQVSSPVVVPAELGSGVMDILQGLASVGIEKLSMQASKLMPLEDITRKSMQQVAWEALPTLEANERFDSDIGRSDIGAKWNRNRSMDYSRNDDSTSEYVSLEDLAPLAMDKIEALSVEGLRIQSGMSDCVAPANIFAPSLGEVSTLEGNVAKNVKSIGMEGAAGLQLLDVKSTGDEVDGLMGLSLTLDEWMKLDSGVVDEEDFSSERTRKILAAHHAKPFDLVSGKFNGDKRAGKGSGRRWGLLGNNFTVALMVQLRDPMRDYEPVGTPMLALIQVERVFIPPKPKVYCSVSVRGNSEEYDEEELEKKPEIRQLEKKEEEQEQPSPQFKIIEVHVAGLKQEPNKKNTWGNSKQQSSGSRWLLATGMGKSSKHPSLKSRSSGYDTIWSVSSRSRNPNVIF